MNSTPYSEKKTSISLRIRAVGHVCSYKNSKQKTKRGIITKPEYQKQMAQITKDFVSQLCLEFQTAGGATVTGLRLPSWTAWCLPLDDSLSWIPQGSWFVEHVNPGQEGADILIEEI